MAGSVTSPKTTVGAKNARLGCSLTPKLYLPSLPAADSRLPSWSSCYRPLGPGWWGLQAPWNLILGPPSRPPSAPGTASTSLPSKSAPAPSCPGPSCRRPPPNPQEAPLRKMPALPKSFLHARHCAVHSLLTSCSQPLCSPEDKGKDEKTSSNSDLGVVQGGCSAPTARRAPCKYQYYSPYCP